MRTHAKKCEYCGTEFTAKREDARFCSNSCRSLHSRHLSGKPNPSFLDGFEVRKHMSESENEQKAKARKQENPEWKRLFDEKNKALTIKETLEKNKNSILNQLSELSVKWNFTFFGSASGATIGDGLGRLLAEDEDKGARIGRSIGAGLGIFGGIFLGKELTKQQTERITILSSQLDELDKRLNMISIHVQSLSSQLKKTPQTVKIRPNKPVNPENGNEVPLSQIKPLELVLRGNNEKSESKPKVMTASEVAEKQFNVWNLGSAYADFLGSPEYGFSALVTGMAGQGKSTFCLKLAGYLANNLGKVLFISSEEGQRMTMQNKIKSLKIESDKLHIAESKSKADLEKVLLDYPTPFVFIDSINHLGINADELEALKTKHPTRSFITIQQANKDGSYKGNSAFGHNTDVIIEVNNGKAVTTKNRFNQTQKELTIY